MDRRDLGLMQRKCFLLVRIEVCGYGVNTSDHRIL